MCTYAAKVVTLQCQMPVEVRAQTSSLHFQFLSNMPTHMLVHRRGSLFEATAGAFSSLFSRPSPVPSASQQVRSLPFIHAFSRGSWPERPLSCMLWVPTTNAA